MPRWPMLADHLIVSKICPWARKAATSTSVLLRQQKRARHKPASLRLVLEATSAGEEFASTEPEDETYTCDPAAACCHAGFSGGHNTLSPGPSGGRVKLH